MKNPIVITSLEEDFKKIGLIKASPAPAPMQESDESDEPDENLDEVRIARRTVAGGRQLGRTTRTPNDKKKKNKRYYAKNKNKINRKRTLRKRIPKVAHRDEILRKRADKRRRTPKARKKHEGSENSPIANPIEEVADIVASIESAPKTDAIKSFANAAIIAEKLQTRFLSWVKNDLCESADDENEFLSLASNLAALAEEFAAIATELHEGEELDADEVTEAFNEGLQFILDAVDLYEANKDEESDEEEMDDEDEDEMDDEESEDDDAGEE